MWDGGGILAALESSIRAGRIQFYLLEVTLQFTEKKEPKQDMKRQPSNYY